jgi:hypothetical protein
VAGDPVNVRAPDPEMSTGHRPHQNLLRRTLRASNPKERHNPGKGTARSGHNFTAGSVALCEAGAGEIVDPGWSDRQGQLVEGSQDP